LQMIACCPSVFYKAAVVVDVCEFSAMNATQPTLLVYCISIVVATGVKELTKFRI